jgi:phosphoglycolate phosphatase-like HAD superfamily hydrolase
LDLSDFAPDCLIFDVDGVLIESRASYQDTIGRCIEKEWTALGNMTDGPGYSTELNTVMKRQGAFNDDYDIIWTLLNIACASGERELSRALPPPGELGRIISECGRDCSTWLPTRYPLVFDRLAIRTLGQDTYTGTEENPGAWTLDEPMLRSHWSRLPRPVYIYTGRDEREWLLAQRTLSWEDFPKERVVEVDMGIKKPSPRGLEYFCEKFGAARPVYFGDTMADKLSADSFGRGWFVAIGDTIEDAELRFPDVRAALRELLGWEE